LGGAKEKMKEQNQKENGPAKFRKPFDETYKRHAVELTLNGQRTVKELAEELGITAGRLYNWRQMYGPQPSGLEDKSKPRTLEAAEEENRKLRAELIRMREREIVLKKSLGILSETPESGMPRSR
jgi:transposase